MASTSDAALFLISLIFVLAMQPIQASETFSNETVLANSSSLAEHTNTTDSGKDDGFLHAMVESFSIIVVSELGDKTFYIAAIFAMTSNKLVVFLSATSALIVMTVLSAALGWVFNTFISRIYTYFACTAIMLLFGLKMLWDAYRMKPDEEQDLQQHIQEDINRRESTSSSHHSQAQQPHDESQPAAASDDDNAIPDVNVVAPDDVIERQHDVEAGAAEAVPMEEVPLDGSDSDSKPKDGAKRVTIREKSFFGKQCHKIFKLFVNCFVMTFLAEWGDPSQLATIVLSSINDMAGVCVGASLSHTLVTALAIVVGTLVAKYIKMRVITFIGGLVFIGFAVVSVFFAPSATDDDDGAKALALMAM